MESVALGIWVEAGGRHEPSRLSGVSHFIEHLLFKGTEKRTARDISRAIEGVGGYLNAFTQEENTCYYARVSSDRTWKALDVLSDMHLNASFRPADLEKERGVIIEEIMMYLDQPQYAVQEMLSGLVWPGHPLGRPVTGIPESIGRMTRNEIVGYHRRAYSPGRTVMAFSGRIDHDSCVDRTGRIFEGIENCGRGRIRRKPVTHQTGQNRFEFRRRNIEQTHLALGFRLFGRHDERKYALKILSSILGENMSSRLFQVVREQHGLAYSVNSSCHLFHDSGVLAVTAGLDPSNYEKALELVVRELQKLKSRTVGEKELKRAKDYVTGQMKLGLESTANRMMWLGENMLSHGKFVSPDDTITKISEVRPHEIQKVARTIFKRSRSSLASITPESCMADESAAERILKKL